MQTFPFPPRIKLKWPYCTYYDSSFYQFYQLELLIRTSISVFKHILYTTMSYISNAKIGCNFITPLFHYTQLQHFYPEVPLQRTGHSTSILYKQRPLTVIYLYFSATTLSHVILFSIVRRISATCIIFTAHTIDMGCFRLSIKGHFAGHYSQELRGTLHATAVEY